MIVYDQNYDVDFDIVDIFFLDITSLPGIQTIPQNYHGIYNITQAMFSFRVICASGFYGPDCTTRCSTPNKTDCAGCLPGYFGEFCSLRQDSCEINNCYNHGKCEKIGSMYICMCDRDYTGKYCQNKIDQCIDADCGNGSCVDGVDSYSCSCDVDFTGPGCNEQINHCSVGDRNPCKNGSTCVDTNGGFVCVCAPDFTGKQCDIHIDDCANVVCTGIKMRCVDGLNTFSCECQEGYSGESCDVKVELSASFTAPCTYQSKV